MTNKEGGPAATADGSRPPLYRPSQSSAGGYGNGEKGDLLAT